MLGSSYQNGSKLSERLRKILRRLLNPCGSELHAITDPCERCKEIEADMQGYQP